MPGLWLRGEAGRLEGSRTGSCAEVAKRLSGEAALVGLLQEQKEHENL